MNAFVQAFGGLIGVALIGIVFVAVLVIADGLMIKVQEKLRDAGDDKKPQ
jgi:hypothetical protein